MSAWQRGWRWWLRESAWVFFETAALDFALVWALGVGMLAFRLAPYLPR